MSTGQHIGKVLIQIRQNENGGRLLVPIDALNRVYYRPSETVVVAGGLGGFGIELFEWLMAKGCQKFVLSLRRDITNKNQYLKVE
jgi:fatty acid synthase